MTRNQIIELALKLGAYKEGKVLYLRVEDLEQFAALVAASEREACAKVCDARVIGDHNREDGEARRCAEAIRARGQE